LVSTIPKAAKLADQSIGIEVDQIEMEEAPALTLINKIVRNGVQPPHPLRR